MNIIITHMCTYCTQVQVSINVLGNIQLTTCMYSNWLQLHLIPVDLVVLPK